MLSALLAVGAAVLPVVYGAPTPNVCASLGSGAVDTYSTGSGVFNLWALNQASYNNAALVTTDIKTVGSSTFSIGIARTDETFESIPKFQLAGGKLSAVDASGAATALAVGNTNIVVSSPSSTGPFTTFSSSTLKHATYCAVPSVTGPLQLAINGQADKFFLCNANVSAEKTNVPALIFNPSTTAKLAGPGTYDGSSCQSYELLLLPA